MTTTLAPPVVIPAARLRHRALAPLLVGALGFIISIAGIGIPSIWYDEAATISSVTRSWPQLWAELGNVDAVHGLYYALIHILFDVVGYSPIALRMPSAIAIGVAAALVVVLGRQLSRSHLGVIAGLVFVLLPRVTWAGTEGRSYAITALLAVALTVVFIKAQTSHRRRWWFGYSALAALSGALFLYLALVVLAHGATILWRLARRDRMAVHSARRWSLAAVAAAIVTTPLAVEIISQSGQVSWIEPIGAQTAGQVFRTQWFYDSSPFAFLAWLLIAAGVIDLLRRRDRVLLATVLTALVLPTLALVVISVVHTPLYQPRYLTMCTPFVAVAIAAGIVALRSRIAAASVLALIVVLAIPQIVSQRLPESKENASWSQIADLVAHERALDGPGVTTAFIYGNVQRHPGATSRVIAYSYPAAFENSIDVTLATPAAETGQLWETRTPIAQSTGRLFDADVAYLITSNARDLRGETIAALAPLGWGVVDQWDFTSAHVLKFERQD
ncbi:glycosyltransferase family 39 protein [soil metagenome]